MFSGLLVGLFVAVSCITVYLCFVTIGALLFKKLGRPIPSSLRVGIVIPAHNEESVIHDTLVALKELDYPQDQYRVFVIADNCTDSTAQVARECGATVVERHHHQRSKGHALHWFFTLHREVYSQCDCLFLIDADTTVDPHCLSEIVSTLSLPGAQVVQGYYTVANPEQSWLSALTYLSFTLANHVRAAGSVKLGSTAGLRGNGMAFRTELIQRYGWPCYSLAEDLEFSLRLLQDDIYVLYNPDAVVRAEMPLTTAQADSQRQRWERGRFALIREYFGPLLTTAISRRSWPHLELLLGLVTPPLSMIVPIVVAFVGMYLGGWLPSSLNHLLLFNVIGLSFYLLVGLILSRPSVAVLEALLLVPYFLCFKIFMYAKMLVGKKDSAWVRTRRNNELP